MRHSRVLRRVWMRQPWWPLRWRDPPAPAAPAPRSSTPASRTVRRPHRVGRRMPRTVAAKLRAGRRQGDLGERGRSGWSSSAPTTRASATNTRASRASRAWRPTASIGDAAPRRSLGASRRTCSRAGRDRDLQPRARAERRRPPPRPAGPAGHQPVGHADDQGRPGAHHAPWATPRCRSAIMDTGVQADHPDLHAQLRLHEPRATSPPTSRGSTDRARRRTAASTRSASTTVATAPTWPARSRRR